MALYVFCMFVNVGPVAPFVIPPLVNVNALNEYNAEGVVDGVGVNVGVTDGVGVNVGVTDGVGVLVGVSVLVGVTVWVGVGVLVGVSVLVGVTVWVGVGVGVMGTFISALMYTV